VRGPYREPPQASLKVYSCTIRGGVVLGVAYHPEPSTLQPGEVYEGSRAAWLLAVSGVDPCMDLKNRPLNPVRDAKMAEAFDQKNPAKARRIFENRDFQSGDLLTWRSDHPERAEMEKDFGPGPFRVRATEEGAPHDGLWLSLFNPEGQAFVSGEWRDVPQGPPYRAVPPTFHSDWFERLPDFESAELRTVAALPHLEWFKKIQDRAKAEGKDTMRLAAAEDLGKPYEAVTKEERANAKIKLFHLVYGKRL